MSGSDVGIVGLGLMGAAMTARLITAGHTVHGYDVDPVRCGLHAEAGGVVHESPASVAASADVVVVSVPAGEHSRRACVGAGGVIEGGSESTLIVDTTTCRPDESESLFAEVAAKGMRYSDTGLSGNSGMLSRGEVLAMVGGSPADLSRIEPVLLAFCRDVMHVGGPGDGMRAKLVVNAVLSVNRFALGEGLVFAEKMGMDLQRTFDVLTASAAYSTAMDMWGQRMVDRDYFPPQSRIGTHNKDAQMTLALGRSHGAPMFALGQVNHLVQAALANDMGEADNAAIIEVLRGLAGVEDGLPAVPSDPAKKDDGIGRG